MEVEEEGHGGKKKQEVLDHKAPPCFFFFHYIKECILHMTLGRPSRLCNTNITRKASSMMHAMNAVQI